MKYLYYSQLFSAKICLIFFLCNLHCSLPHSIFRGVVYPPFPQNACLLTSTFLISYPFFYSCGTCNQSTMKSVLQKVTKLVTLLVFMKSLCACQFSKFSKAVNSYNIASISKSSANYSQFSFAK